MARPLALLSLLLVVGCAKGLNAPGNGGAGGQSVVQTTGIGPGTTANTVGSTTIGSTVAATTDTTVTTDAATTDATVGSTTVATTGVTTTASTTVTTGSGTCSLGGTMNAMACTSCSAAGDCPSPWPLSWDADPNATYYIVSYQCFVPTPHTYQTTNTTVDLCNEVGMCNDGTCSFGAGPVYVQSCNATCCGPKVQFDPSGTPIACGGGACC